MNTNKQNISESNAQAQRHEGASSDQSSSLERIVSPCLFPVKRFDMSGNPAGDLLEAPIEVSGRVKLPWLNLLFCPLVAVRSLGQKSPLHHYSAPQEIYESRYADSLYELEVKLKQIYPEEFDLLCDRGADLRCSKMWQPVSPLILAHVLAQIQCSDSHTLIEWKNHQWGLGHAILESFPIQRRHTMFGPTAYGFGELLEGNEPWINAWVYWANETSPPAKAGQKDVNNKSDSLPAELGAAHGSAYFVGWLSEMIKAFLVFVLSPVASHILSTKKAYMIGQQLQKMRLHKECQNARKQARILWAEEKAKVS